MRATTLPWTLLALTALIVTHVRLGRGYTNRPSVPEWTHASLRRVQPARSRLPRAVRAPQAAGFGPVGPARAGACPPCVPASWYAAESAVLDVCVMAYHEKQTASRAPQACTHRLNGALPFNAGCA